MKFIYFLSFLVLLNFSKAFCQQCSGNACSVIIAKSQPTATSAWQFSNTSDSIVKIGLRLYNGDCSATGYYNIGPHQRFFWGAANQNFCPPFEANFVTAAFRKETPSKQSSTLVTATHKTEN